MRQSLQKSGVTFLGVRHDLGADERAEAIGMFVGGVIAPKSTLAVTHNKLIRIGAFLQVVAQVLSANLKKRTRHLAVQVTHSAETTRARAHDRAHIEVLNAIVGSVRRENAPLGNGCTHVAAQADQRVVRCGIALTTRNGLDVAAFSSGNARYVDLACEQRDP